MSGLSRTPGKRVWVYPHRGFESRLLRHIELPRALRGFFFVFCERLALLLSSLWALMLGLLLILATRNRRMPNTKPHRLRTCFCCTPKVFRKK